jgi:hypothetical protein
MSFINFSADMRIVPFLTHNDREICFVNEEIVQLIACSLDRARDVLSFGSVNHRVYSILIANPSPSFRRFFLNLSNILPSIDSIERPVTSWEIVPYSPPSMSSLQTQVHNFLTGSIINRPMTIRTARLISAQDVISLRSVNRYVYNIPIANPYHNIRIGDMTSGTTLSDEAFLATHNGLLTGAFDIPSDPISESFAREMQHSFLSRGRIDPHFISGSGPQHPMQPTNNSPEEDFLPNYTNFVESTNNLRHETALQSNTDGGQYLKLVIDEHMQTLSDNERAEFKNKIEESDPALFTEIPNLAVKKAISSTVPLTRKNTPLFMHDHLNQLEQLRKTQKSLNAADLRKESGIIATKLQRETDCIASMQKALQSFS